MIRVSKYRIFSSSDDRRREHEEECYEENKKKKKRERLTTVDDDRRRKRISTLNRRLPLGYLRRNGILDRGFLVLRSEFRFFSVSTNNGTKSSTQIIPTVDSMRL